MKKFIIFILISNFAFSAEYNWYKAPVKKKPVFKFVHITDTHCISNAEKKKEPKFIIQIGPYRPHWKDSFHSFLILEKTVEYIKERIKPAFLVHTGDITEDGNYYDLKRAKEILEKLGIPFYVIKGDHDGLKNRNFERVFGRRCYSVDYGRWHFLFVSVSPSERELKWIKDRIEKNPRKPTVLFTHRLIFCDILTSFIVKEFYDKNAIIVMEKAEFFKNLFKNFKNIKMVISGDIHTNLYYKKDEIHCISTSSLVEIPHQFRVFEFYRDEIKIKLLTACRLKDVKEKNWKVQKIKIIEINLKGDGKNEI